MGGSEKSSPSTLDEARDRYDAKSAVGQLDAVYADAERAFGGHNPERLEQLRSALETARMAVEHLKSETPFTL